MKIYVVKPDANFRLMFPEKTIYRSEEWEFKCKPLAGRLPLHFDAYFNDTDDDPLPDIAWLGMSTFAFRSDVAEALLDILEEAGELLPFTVKDQQWYCFNVLQKADNAIDPEKSKYEIDDGEMRFGLTEPAFIMENLPSTSLFKIKDDNYTMTYCADRRDTEEDVLANFFCAIAGHGYTGVKFEEAFDG